jgi:hypothetical protein
MCTPAAFAAISVVTTGIRIFGVLQQSRAASAQADFKTRIAQNNAQISENNAQAVEAKAEVDIEEKRRETRQRLSLQRTQIAAAGFQLGVGTGIDILGDTAALGELDVLRIDEDARNQAQNFRAQGANFQTEAELGRLSRKNIERAGKIKVAETLITGASRAGTLLSKKTP